METFLAPLLSLLTLFLVIKRPFGIGIGWSAWLGAGLCLLLGLISVRDIFYIASLVWDATVAFVFLVFISIVLDRAGFFEWFALKAIHAAGGSGTKLFLMVLLLGAFMSAFFANDGSALMLTPIIYAQMKHLNLPQRHLMPYLMGAGFVADSASLPLVISNLTNIITAHFFGLDFWTYAFYMALPNLVSVGLSLLCLYLLYRKELIKSYEPEVLYTKPSAMAVRDPFVFKMGFVVLLLLALAFLLLELLYKSLPVSSVLGFLSFLLALSTFKNRVVSLTEVLRFTPWHIVFFSIGMYAVVYSLKSAGYTQMLAWLFNWFVHQGELVAILGVGYSSALLSALTNNLPTVMTVNLSIQEAGFQDGMAQLLALANLIGTNIGPKLTPIGSLATLLWLHLLEYHGIKIGWGYYTKVGLILTLPVLTGALVSLWLVFLFFSWP